jgi:lysophospholipase L1-like esterase
LYCLGEDASEQCGTLSPTVEQNPTGTDITTSPGEEEPSTEPVTTTEPGEATTTPCPTTGEGIEESTESTVSVQHGHRHHNRGGWLRGFFRWLLELLIELINKLLGGKGGITLPPVDPCVTPAPTVEPIPTVEEEPTTPVEDTIAPTNGTTIAPTTSSGVTPTTGAGGTKSQVILMPLGDSITDGGDSMGGYRLDLWKKLVQTDGDKIDFVGSLNGGPSDLGDKDHEGHIGWNITELDEQISGWMTSSKPDIVLLHIGTNDLDQGASASEMETNLKKLITDIYTAKPDTALVVSSLIVTTVGEKATWTAYNAAIPGIVNGFKSQGKNITYVDMSNSLTESDLDDGAHPTWEGYSKMATVWYPVVKSLYDSMIAK